MEFTNHSTLLDGCKHKVTIFIPPVEGISLSICLILMTLLAIFGNSLVVLAISKYKKLQVSSNAFLCSLAVGDLLSPILRLIWVAISLLYKQWVFGCMWCRISSATGVFFCSASIIHMCVISLDRYLSIRYPLRYRGWLTKTKLVTIFFSIWLLSLLMALFPYLRAGATLHFNRYVLHCEFYLVNEPELSIALALVYFLAPVSFITVFYIQIYRINVAFNRRLSNQSNKRVVEQKRRVLLEWRAVKTILIVVCMFFILWSPIFCVSIIKAYKPRWLPGWLQRLSFCTAYMSTCLNWIVYSVMHKEFRNAFITILSLKKSVVSANEGQYTSGEPRVIICYMPGHMHFELEKSEEVRCSLPDISKRCGKVEASVFEEMPDKCLRFKKVRKTFSTPLP